MYGFARVPLLGGLPLPRGSCCCCRVDALVVVALAVALALVLVALDLVAPVVVAPVVVDVQVAPVLVRFHHLLLRCCHR